MNWAKIRIVTFLKDVILQAGMHYALSRLYLQGDINDRFFLFFQFNLLLPPRPPAVCENERIDERIGKPSSPKLLSTPST